MFLYKKKHPDAARLSIRNLWNIELISGSGCFRELHTRIILLTVKHMHYDWKCMKCHKKRLMFNVKQIIIWRGIKSEVKFEDGRCGTKILEAVLQHVEVDSMNNRIGSFWLNYYFTVTKEREECGGVKKEGGVDSLMLDNTNTSRVVWGRTSRIR